MGVVIEEVFAEVVRPSSPPSAETSPTGLPGEADDDARKLAAMIKRSEWKRKRLMAD